MQYAGFLRRLVAYLVDVVVFYAAFFVISLPFGSGVDMETGEIDPTLNIIFFVISWIYFAVMESSPKQATLGKMAIGIKVTDLDGDQISFARATGRYFAKFISAIILLIGYFMAGFTEKKQGLHDIMAGTLVVVK